jgi:hypothetical protein
MSWCPICALCRRINRWWRRRRPLTPEQEIERAIERLNRHEEAARQAGWWW